MKSKYLNTFDRTADYDAYIESSLPEFPNVGYDKQEDKVKIRRESPNNHLLYGTLTNPSGAVPNVVLYNNDVVVNLYAPAADTTTGEFYIDNWGTVPEFDKIIFSPALSGSNVSSLKKIKELDTSKVTNMNQLFSIFTGATTIDVTSLDTSNVTNMDSMFAGCQYLNSLDISGFDTSKVTNMNAMFYQCSSLNTLDLSNFDTSNVTNMRYMFNGTALTSLDVSGFDTSKVTNMNAMFKSSTDIPSLDVSNFVTSNVTDMQDMFNSCRSLTSLDVSNFNTSNVTTMRGMFWSCRSLTSLDLSNFDVSNVTDMQYMFRECGSLTSLDVSKFNTSNVTTMSGMFWSCSSLTSLDVSNFVTSNVTNMQDMFNSCRLLTSLDVSNFNTSNVTTMRDMFNSCSSLTSLDLSNFDVSKVTDMQYMFRSCSSLTSLDLSGWDIQSSTNISNMFRATDHLTDVYITEQSTFDKLTNNGTSQGGNTYIPSSATIHYNGTDITWNGSYWEEQQLGPTSITFQSFDAFNNPAQLGDFQGDDSMLQDGVVIMQIGAQDMNSSFDDDVKNYCSLEIYDDLGNEVSQQCTFTSDNFNKEEDPDSPGSYFWVARQSITTDDNNTPYELRITAQLMDYGFSDDFVGDYTVTYTPSE